MAALGERSGRQTGPDDFGPAFAESLVDHLLHAHDGFETFKEVEPQWIGFVRRFSTRFGRLDIRIKTHHDFQRHEFTEVFFQPSVVLEDPCTAVEELEEFDVRTGIGESPCCDGMKTIQPTLTSV